MWLNFHLEPDDQAKAGKYVSPTSKADDLLSHCHESQLFPDSKLHWNAVSYDSLGLDQEVAIYLLS